MEVTRSWQWSHHECNEYPYKKTPETLVGPYKKTPEMLVCMKAWRRCQYKPGNLLSLDIESSIGLFLDSPASKAAKYNCTLFVNYPVYVIVPWLEEVWYRLIWLAEEKMPKCKYKNAVCVIALFMYLISGNFLHAAEDNSNENDFFNF